MAINMKKSSIIIKLKRNVEVIEQNVVAAVFEKKFKSIIKCNF